MAETPEQVRALPTATDDYAEQARLQAEAYDSLFANTDIKLDDGTMLSIPPHPDFGMLDDDAMDDYAQLLFDRDTVYEREPDIIIPEQRMKNSEGVENGVVMPSETIRGALKTPYRIKTEDGSSVLVKPAWSTQMVIAGLGKESYEMLRAGGRSSADVWRIWSKQGEQVKQRQGRSEAERSPVAVAPVPTPDS